MSGLALGAAGLAGRAASQQGAFAPLDPAAETARARKDILAARRQGAAARRRAEIYEARARAVTRAADRTAREAAAIAARIQESEAALAVQQAQVRLIASQRDGLRARLARRQEPLARLTGALQRLSRRPPLLALLRPGSVQDLVYMRALLDTMLPEVERRTAGLRGDIARARALETQATAAVAQLRAGEAQLRARRTELARLESRQRLEGRAASGIAARENDRALAMAERARDLGDLVVRVGQQAELRSRLAALPGPIPRPARPDEAEVRPEAAPAAAGLESYALPVSGRLVTGFGEDRPGERPSAGIVLATRANAQVVAPGAGRVAFAAPYRGFGRIVIIEHSGEWTSLVTGLARLDVSAGDELVAGSPLGMTGPGEPRVMIELRRDGKPVNPLQYVRAP